ncbi:hypothetical protein VE01_02892 [Pseudogymnoascus verrucosus]|uniref:DUF6594 domain-containing protein n=1 Tax=Pseudogymnoascus verrucosus TaxID=342668 RepID=A0A1B8GUW7_9PEZI|nr:uncharacterized protein VE01_02892 [Pseudogymnoascus verrucosus]OBT99590.1 hypothetical protein VE01_02892 [Pseudogymnoascus verrucosus]
MNQGYELPPAKPLNGFPRVAHKLASDPDRTTTIFRRFDRLSARNLILLEAEVAELEARQDRFDEEDKISTSEEVRSCHTEWSTFERLATERDADGNPTNLGQATKLELARRFKVNSEEIDEALAVHQTLLNSKPPAATTIKGMREWFLDTHNGKQYGAPQLWGASEKRFDDPYDLVALRVPADQDRLSEFILNYFGGFFPATSTDPHSSYIRESTLAKTIAIISSILSAILLFGSIASLYFVHNGLALLGMLGGWTVLFAVCVGWLTNARRDQVFAATAAYCAVLVVFVSGTLGGAAGGQVVVGEGGWNCTRGG